MSAKIRTFSAGVSAIALSMALTGHATAQELPAIDPRNAPTVVVDDSAPVPAPYRNGQGADSSVSVFDEDSIQTRAPGTGDVLQILKQAPGVQFAIGEGTATRDSLRDLRPSEISISGGRPSENLFILDGVGVNALMETDVTDGPSGLLDYDNVRGASSQTIWVDSDLVGAVTLRDANVSAEFGRFTGGVVEIVTRDPARVFGMRGSYNWTSDSMARYHLSPSYTGAERPKPAFDRERWSVSADLPISERLSMLASYTRAEATTYNNWSASLTEMSGEAFDQTNTSESFMLKGLFEPSGDLRLSAQVTHAPYESTYVRTGGINTLSVHHGGGTTARLNAAGSRGEADWDLNLTWALSDTDREGENWRFDVRGGLEPWCTGTISTSCENGYVGAIHQRQQDLTLSGNWSQPLWNGDLRMGFSISDIDAEKSRADGGVYSFNGTTAVVTAATGPLTACASATDISCIAGRYAFNRLVVYPAYDAQVSLQTYGLWAEFAREWAGFDVRLGLRYDHETFLANHTISPRFSISRELPWGINATFGLNRYYGRSFLGYAMREKLTNTLTYGRTYTTVNGQRVWSPNWVLNTVTIPQRYSNQNLDSPYNDEASLALTGPLLGGQWRVRGVYREGKDLFSRSLASSFTLIDELGNSRTINRYNITNGGTSSYESVSLDYTRSWRRHTFSFSTNWSDTTYNADSYFDPTNEDVGGATMVWFQGQLMGLGDLLNENQRLDFAAPFMFNLDWNSKWFDDRLNVTVGGRYRGEFEQIESTTSFQNVNGTNYRIYEIVQYRPSVDLDANVSYALLRGNHDVQLEARISNVLDKIPNRNQAYSSQPWQLGRSAWVGLRVRY
jgi:hypothetical protein